MQNNTLPAGHLTTALNAGYLLEDILPLIPINGPLKPETRDQDGMVNPALTPEEVAMGKQPGKYVQTATGAYWVRRKAWNSTSITQDEIAIHDGAGCNLGFKTGVRVVALDVDITNEAIMSVLRPALMELGLEHPIRTGRYPKALWLFAVVGDPIPRRQIPLIHGDEKHLIEVLGITSTGNPSQCAALGMHPAGTAYEWEGYAPGALPAFHDLPRIDVAGMDRIVKATLSICETLDLIPTQYETETGGNPETSGMGLVAEPDLVTRVMEVLPNAHDWKGWKDTGLALFNAVGPEIGAPIWEAWSAKSEMNDPDTTDWTWRRGMWPNNQSSGFGSLVKQARRALGGKLPDDIEAAIVKRKFEHIMPAEYQSPFAQQVQDKLFPLVNAGAVETEHQLDELSSSTGVGRQALKADLKRMRDQLKAVQIADDYLTVHDMSNWFTGCVYVIEENKVFSPAFRLLDRDRFNAMFGGRVFQMSPDGTKTTSEAWKAFTQNRAATFAKVSETTFRPEYGYGQVVCKTDGTYAVNTLKMPNVHSSNDPVGPFLTHLAKLLPVERDRTILLAWMAAVVQNPGRKLMWAPVLQGTEGNGKSYVMKVMEYCIGQSLTHWLNPEDMNEKYNGYLAENLLICVEEIHMSDRREILDRLKKYITSDRVEIRKMGQDKVTKDSLCVFMFCTNWEDAILKSANDRRFAVFFTAQQTADDLFRHGMDAAYFRDLWNWTNSGGYAAVLGFLRTYQIADDDHPLTGAIRAPKTSSNDAAVAASMGNYETIILEYIEEGHIGVCGGWVNLDILGKHVENEIGRKVNPVAMSSALRNLGYRKLKPRQRLNPGSRKQTTLYAKTVPEDGVDVAAAYRIAQGQDYPWINSDTVVLPLAHFNAVVELQDGTRTTYGKAITMPNTFFRHVAY